MSFGGQRQKFTKDPLQSLKHGNPDPNHISTVRDMSATCTAGQTITKPRIFHAPLLPP